MYQTYARDYEGGVQSLAFLVCEEHVGVRR